MWTGLSQYERRRFAWGQSCVFALLTVPILGSSLFSSRPRSVVDQTLVGVIITVLLACPIYYQRAYGFKLRPQWNWQLARHAKPDLHYVDLLPWPVRVVGWMAIGCGLFFCSALFFEPEQKSEGINVPFLFSLLWIGGLLLIGGVLLSLECSGVYVYQNARTVTAWWGLGWPMLRKDFCFEEFTDTSIHLIPPRILFERRGWRVWLREPSSTIWIRARNRDEAKRIGIELAEIIGVKYWPHPDEQQPSSIEAGP